jgi:transposase-like protein
VDTIARVRREYLVRGRSIREIARELHISRNTVRKILRSGETEFVYERTVQPQPKLGSWRVELDRLLAVNTARSSRERLTLIRVFEELRVQGYEGGYDAVRRYAASWQRERSAATAAAFVPLSFAPGEAYQFDWSHEIVLIKGTTVMVKVAHLRLCHSRMLFVRAYPRESQEMVFDAHDRAFAFFRGAWAKAQPHPEVRDKTIWQMFEAERPSLVPNVGPFDGSHAIPASPSKTCLVRFDNNKYSVAASAVGRPVEMRAYAERIELRQDGRIVGSTAAPSDAVRPFTIHGTTCRSSPASRARSGMGHPSRIWCYRRRSSGCGAN